MRRTGTKLYYKKLDWDSSLIQSQLWDYCVRLGFDIMPIKQTFVPVGMEHLLESCPALVEFFKVTNFQVMGTALYMAETQRMSNVHVDRFDGNIARINFPAMNPNNADTAFYTVAPGTIHLESQKNGVTYYRCSDPNPIEVARVTIDKPTVINVIEPHNVILKQEGVRRIALSVKVSPDPVYLLNE